MSKTRTRTSLTHQLIKSLLVFVLVWQPLTPLDGAAAEGRRANSQSGGRAANPPARAADGFRHSGDARPLTPPARDDSGGGSQDSVACAAATSAPRASSLTYLGRFEGECGQPFAVAARLADECGNALADRQLTFSSGAQSVSAMTDAGGVARSSLAAQASAAPLPLAVSFAGDDEYAAARDAASLKVERVATFIRYTGPSALAAGASESVSAVLTDAGGGRPVPGAVLNFAVGSARASGTTGADGVAVATITLPPAETFDRSQLKINFAGDACRDPADAEAEVTAYLRTSFVVWGGNSERLRLGQRVNFWGHSWAKQVAQGDYKAHGDFKGYADTVRQPRLCQVNARTTARPPLDDSCWSTKPGQSFPPQTIPGHIGVIVTTSMDKKGSPDFGNVAALVVVKVDPEPRYGADPGKPGFGTIAAVIADGEGVFGGSPSLAASQTQPAAVLPAQSFNVNLTVTNNSTATASNVLVRESFGKLSPPEASDALGTLPPSGVQARGLGATVPALQPRREGESSTDYQRRLGAAEGTVYSSLAVVSFQDAAGRAMPPVFAASSSTLQIPRLAVGISAPSCVGPGATVPYVIRLTNVGGAAAASAAAVVRFADGTTTRVETTNLEPGQVFSSTVNWKVPVVAPKGAAESDADYVSRLKSLDGKPLKTTASVTWKDGLGNDYGAVEQECASVERVPVLTQAAPAPPTMLPAQKVTLPTAVRNTGSAGALQARLRATNPDSSVFDAAPFSLPAGNSSDVPTTLTAPPVAPKAAGETDEAYQARLQAADNQPVDFALALEWTDAAGNTYGPLVEAVRANEVLPVVLVSLSAPETAEAGDRVTYEVTADNAGHADAVGINLVVTLPDGQVQPVTLPDGAIPPGGRQASVVEFVVPEAQAEGQISAQATVNWRDAAANGYGPMSASAVTNVVNPNRPPQVNAGPDQSVLMHAAASLDGTADDDGKPSGSTLSVRWTKVSGPGAVAFADPNAAATAATFSADGTYVLRLTASDSVLSASDEATVVVTLPPSGQTYGGDADLSGCGGVNVVCDESNHLHLNNEATPFNFIWVAVSSKGTIVKIDTDTGRVLGEYFSSPAGQPRDPSRTTVDHNGNVWASNRAGNSVLRIGLVENGQCVDRNGNGVIDTSRAQNDLRPWTNAGGVDTDGGVETADDECVINYTRVRSSGTRHVSVNAANDVWVSGTGGEKFDLVDGTTGQIKRQEGPVGYGGYGGLIDAKGVIWSARPLLRWDTALPLKGANGGTWKGYSHDSYGLCIDSGGNVWNSSNAGNVIRKFAPDGTLLGSFDHGSNSAQGCVVDKKDHVWVAHSLNSRTVGHLKPDGTFLGNVTVGNGPTGVAVDAKGRVWSTNHGSRTVSRIDPELGPVGADGETRVGQVDFTSVDLKGNLYNYSDMTGSTLSGAPASGTWTQVFDSGIEGAEWGVVGWNGRVCSDSALLVSVSSSADGVSFSAPVAATNGAAFNVPPGRHLKVSVVFRRAASGESPFLYSLTVGTKGYKLPAADNQPPAVDAGLDQTATMPNAANLVGNVCDAGRVSGLNVSWSKVSGPGSVTFANAQLAATSATFDEAGEYTLRLTAGDAGLSSSDEMTVVVLPFNDPPAVNAGADQSLILPASASLAGTVSDDALPRDSSVAVNWSKMSGPGEVTFADDRSSATAATFSEPGDYVLRLVGDDSQLANVDEVAVKVYPPNNAPAVNAGDDRTIRLPEKAALDAAVTDDGLPLGKTVAVAWTKASGPGTVSFANSKAADTTAAFSLPGTYVLRLTASDTQLSAADELTVVVNPANQPPSVGAGADQAVTLPEAAPLSGTVTDDGLPEGSAVTATWSKVSGPGSVTFNAPQSPATTASFSEAGTYVLRLSAGDSALTRSDDVAVTVRPSPFNLPPTVVAGADQTITLPAKASLAGVAADDKQPAGAALTVAWSKSSGPGNVTFANAAAVTTTAAFSAPGVYVLKLTAGDTALTAADEVAVTVLPVNQPPVVKAGADQTIAFPAAASLTGTATDDGQPAGGRLTSVWSKLSGPGEVTFADAGAPVTKANFSTGGKYVLRLTASDSALSRTDDLSVTVNQAPTADAGADQSTHLPNPVALAGRITDDALPAGKVIVVNWSKVSGPGPVTFAKPGATSTTATFGEVGTYVLRLTADDSLLAAHDELTVKVNPPLPPPPSVTINSPTDGAEITSPLEVTGSVSKGSWKLEYSLGPDPAAPGSAPWTVIASGVAPVTNGVFGTFDPTRLLNGTYSVRLTAADADGQAASVVKTVAVAGKLKAGFFSISYLDLDVPVAGIPIQVFRTYDSRDTRTGDFGAGWKLMVRNVRLEKSVELGAHWRGVVVSGTLPQYCLQPSRPNFVTITLPNEKVYKFQATTAKQCQALVPITEARFGFTPMPGTKGTLIPEAPVDVLAVGGFPGPFELANAADPRLNVYDPTTFRFTDENGVVYVIDQKDGLRSVADRNGNRLTISDAGILHSSGRSIAFTRDALNRITRVTDPDGNSLTYTYDARGDLVRMADQVSNASRYAYDSAHGLLEIFDAAGRRGVRNEYDPGGRLVSTTDADGHTVRHAFDPRTRQEVQIDRKGRPVVFEYDRRGNALSITDQAGVVIRATFDAGDRPLTTTDKLGQVTRFTYDPNGNLLTRTDADGNVTRYAYDARGLVTSETDANGNKTAYTYDAAGNRTSATDALGQVTRFTYDARGRQLTEADPSGKVSRKAYDAFGNVTQETDRLGNVFKYTYNGLGLRTSATDARGNTTHFTYDAAGRPLTEVDPLGNTTRMEHDVLGNMSAHVDAAGRRAEAKSDARSRPLQLTQPDGSQVSLRYDAADNLVGTSLPGGLAPALELNNVDRVTKVKYTEAVSVSYQYDAKGRVVSQTDGRGNTTTLQYNVFDEVALGTGPSGAQTRLAYDGVGNLVGRTDPLGNTTTYTYDKGNRPVRTTLPGGAYTENVYDALGQVVSHRDAAGNVTAYAHDAEGRLLSLTDAAGGVTRYEYDANGSLASVTDAKGRKTSFEYDRAGNLSRKTYPDGTAELYEYNAVGLPVAFTDRAGAVVRYEYDDMDRLSRARFADGTSVSYTYAPDGQRDTVTDARGVTDFDYDGLGQLLRVRHPDGVVISYTYDAGRTRASMTTPAGTTLYEYDAENRLKRVTAAGGLATEYAYDAAGNATQVSHPNGARTASAYDAQGRVTSVQTTDAAGRTIFREAYTLDPLGNRTRVSGADGSSVEYAYDALSRVVGERRKDPTGAVTSAYSFTYDAVGNRLTQTGPGATRAYTYDGNDRLTSDGASAYSYDGAGNTTAVKGPGGQTLYAYDAQGRLVRVTLPDGTVVSHTYDALGSLVRTERGGAAAATNFYHDLSDPVSQVVLETVGDGSVSASYTYGRQLISQRRGGSDAFYHHDAHGSVRALTDAGGSAVAAYSYTAFGELSSSGGSVANDRLYAGEQFDASTGLYNLRARHYNPAAGRFITADPFPGFEEEPQSLHKYAYASNNPVNRVDPLGLYTRAQGQEAHRIIGRAYILNFIKHYAEGGRWGWGDWFVARGERPNKWFPPYPGYGAYNRKIRGQGAPRRFPDLRNYLVMEVYEIKPLSAYGLLTGPRQVRNYITLLNKFEPRKEHWTLGRQTVPGISIFNGTLLGTFYVYSIVPGLIFYTNQPYQDYITSSAAAGEFWASTYGVQLLSALEMARGAPVLASSANSARLNTANAMATNAALAGVP
jgi:RHS repeat-associated protein/uncharacterized repeat protein (TIGR01451 family)